LCLIELDEVEAQKAAISGRISSATNRAVEVLRSTNTPLFKQTETAVVCNEVIADIRCNKSSGLKKNSLNIMKPRRRVKSASTDGGSLIGDEWLEQLAPKCSGHSMPAKLLRVKKAGPNKVRCGCGGFTFPRLLSVQSSIGTPLLWLHLPPGPAMQILHVGRGTEYRVIAFFELVVSDLISY
jgi:hypothetical protein